MTRISRSGNQPSQQRRSDESAAPAQGHAGEPAPRAGGALAGHPPLPLTPPLSPPVTPPVTPPPRLDATVMSGPPPLKRRIAVAASASACQAGGPAMPLAPTLGSGSLAPGLRGAPALFGPGRREAAPRAGLPVLTLAQRDVRTTRNPDADADAEVAFINRNAAKAPPSLP